MASIEILKKVAKISKRTGFTSLCYFLNKNRKRIIAYHNIIPDEYFDDSLHLSHSMKESSFKKQLEIIKDRLGFTLDIDDTSKVTLTFDDGYLNQYSVASKIMDEKSIKGYFFCVSNLIKNNEAFVMDKIQYWFSYVPYGSYYIDQVDIRLDIKDKDSRTSEWKKIDNIIGEIPIEKVEDLLDNAYSFANIKIKDDYMNLRFRGISMEEIDVMKKNGHKIGAHSSYHKKLSVMDKDELSKDISICGDMLGDIYNTSIFCYPFGSRQDINSDVIEEIKSNNFTHGFAYSNGSIEGGYDRYFMPRMFLHDTGDDDLIDFVLSGAKHFMSFRRLLPKY